MMARKSRNKGARGEREVAELLRPLYPNVRRRCTGEESQAGAGRDLDGTPGLCVQCNLSAAPNPLKKLREARKAAQPAEIAVAVVRKTGSGGGPAEPWVVCMTFDDFKVMLGWQMR